MGYEEEVIKIKKKLDKMVSAKSDQSQAQDLLAMLQRLPINLQILTQTRIGMSVNALRKSSNDNDVINTSKQLIKSWKKYVPEKKDLREEDRRDEDIGEESKSSQNNGSASSSSLKDTVFPRAPPTTDTLRIKCTEMLTNAINHHGELPDGTVESPNVLAEQIEEAIYQEFNNTSTSYKSRIRSRVYNLKDSKNPGLRENLLIGTVAPKRFAVMTAEDMASAEMKAIREKFTKESIDDHQLAIAQGTKTELLRCGKCGKRDCVYNQMQTRSADEPMTTFVLCNKCGNRWKFC